MKSFLKNRSYDMVKMFLNQFAVALFGLSLAVATGLAKRPALRNATYCGQRLWYDFSLLEFGNLFCGLYMINSSICSMFI